MRKDITLMAIVTVTLLFIVSACGGKYDDVIGTNDAFVDATENYCQAMEKANGATDIADALNDYAGMVEKLAPKMKALAEKYPELENQDQIPEELKESQDRATEAGIKFAGQMMKSIKLLNIILC